MTAPSTPARALAGARPSLPEAPLAAAVRQPDGPRPEADPRVSSSRGAGTTAPPGRQQQRAVLLARTPTVQRPRPPVCRRRKSPRRPGPNASLTSAPAAQQHTPRQGAGGEGEREGEGGGEREREREREGPRRLSPVSTEGGVATRSAGAGAGDPLCLRP
jgi:hypothetical protein